MCQVPVNDPYPIRTLVLPPSDNPKDRTDSEYQTKRPAVPYEQRAKRKPAKTNQQENTYKILQKINKPVHIIFD